MWIKKLRNEFELFFIAMGFFTRIPVPTWVSFNKESLNKANRYFALIGILVGAISALIYALSLQILPVSVSIIFAMLTSILITGAFHEDGLADCADGLGGGWTIADKLKIMKDSNIGTYGAVTLVLTLLFKFTLLIELAKINANLIIPALILAHCLSRVASASIIFTDNYVSESETSKSKSLAKNQSLNELLILIITGVFILIVTSTGASFSLIIGLIILRYLLALLFRKQIGGYTGDTLGATQQVSELLCYLILLGSLS